MTRKQENIKNKNIVTTDSTNIESTLKNPLIVCLLAGICCLLWGSAFPCIKIGYQLFQIEASDTASQLLFAGCRFTLAGILVLVFALFQQGLSGQWASLLPRQSHTWKRMVILSLFQTILQYIFFYIGLAHTSGVKASIIEGTNVFVAILMASLIFHQEKLTLAKIFGCLMGFLGVILVNLGTDGFNLSLHFIGEGFIFLSTFAYALSSVIIKDFSKKDNPILLSGWQFLIGGLILTTIGALLGGHIQLYTLSQTSILLYLAFISAGAYTLWSILIKYNPVSQVSVYGFMNPVFGVLLSYFLLHDSAQTIGVQSLLALVLVCTGIYIVNKNEKGGFL